jgi:putative oxidoreductase
VTTPVQRTTRVTPLSLSMRRAIALYARLTLGSAFLSTVASRFGLWDGSLDRVHFQRFLKYAAEVNSFLPSAWIPFLAWSATLAETVLGVALVAGIRLRLTAFCASVLLALFGSAMAISFGPQSPLDYSVFSASAAALLLANFDSDMRKPCEV